LGFAFLASCSMIDKPKKNDRAPEGTVSVKVIGPEKEKGFYFLAAYPAFNGPGAKPLQTFMVKNGSVTGFLLPVDKEYEFRAFIDKSGKGEPQPGQGVGSARATPDPDVHAATKVVVVTVPEAGEAPGKAKPELVVPPDTEKTELPKKTKAAAPAELGTPATGSTLPVAPAPPVPPTPPKP
jgi:hypothetical protein